MILVLDYYIFFDDILKVQVFRGCCEKVSIM